jgi:uncharacterized protein (DUF2336 family)
LSAAQTAEELNTLAKSREPADRERLLLAIVDLCSGAGAAIHQPQIQGLIGSLLNDLVANAEHDIRARLAEKLAVSDWPPADLINGLALDDIEIARPVIAGSPLLQDVDLVRLLVQTGVGHQIEIAQRPRIGPPVVETIISQAQPAVLTALAGNDTAEISPDAMSKLVDASRELASLRSPLVRHPRMTGDLAEKLYAWVGQSLRMAIVSRFRVDAEALDRAIAEAVGEAQQQKPTGGPLSEEQRDMERRLIEKLHQAGQLRPGYLLRALREQRLSLFESALAALGGYEFAAVRKALNADGPETLALACVGVGVDRSVFSTILALVRELNGGRPAGEANRARRVFDTFGPGRAKLAAAAFRRLSNPETTAAG